MMIDCIPALYKMPAQNGDPIAAAIHSSLVSVKKCGGGGGAKSLGGTAGEGSKEAGSLNSLVTSARLVLSSEVKYERSPSLDSTAVLGQLKSKYIVLSPAMGSTYGKFSAGDDSGKKFVKSGDQLRRDQCTVSPSNNNTVAGGSGVALPIPKKVLYPPESVLLGWKGSIPVGSGFVNLGNTCYLNSTLQALFHVPAFVNWLLNDMAHTAKCELINGMTHSECLICAMVMTLQCSHRCTGSAIKPLQIYSKLKSICKHLVHGHQEDAHEFLRYLIEGMEKCYLNLFNALKLETYSKETTPLNQIFGGYIRTEVTCLECHHVSTTFQHFQDLLLDIRQVGSVEEALDSYFGREKLGDEEQVYKCEQCHKRVAATKKFSLERPPKALCIQLKRFGAMGGKNTKHINLKQFLDISKYRHRGGLGGSNEALKYRLVAMVTHLGPSACCGHYTAVGQSAVGSYYLFDDSVVRPLSVNSILATNAYIIIYEQESSNQQPQNQQLSLQSAGQKLQDSTVKLVSSNGYLNGVEAKPSLNTFSMPVVEKSTPVPSSAPKPPERPALVPPTQARFSSSEPRACGASSTEKPKDKKPFFGSAMKPSETGGMSPSRSLVPYLSESSDSESEASSLTSPERNSSPLSGQNNHHSRRIPNGSPRVNRDQHHNSTSNTPRMCKLSLNGRSSNGSSTPTKSDRGATSACGSATTASSSAAVPPLVEVDTVSQSWEVMPAARLPAPSPTGSVGSSSGQWSITSNDREKTTTEMGSQSVKQNGGSAVCGNGKGKPNGGNESSTHNNNNNNTNANDKAWDGNRHNSTVGQLLKMSHRGYGTGNVNSWNGNRSDLDRESEAERMQLKRSHSNSGYDEELDRGKVKKQKKYHQFKEERRNRFQEFQNRKNNWGGRGGSRQNFYRQYTYEHSRGHHYNRWHH